MKAIWSGAIGFGLVNIPIKIYSAVQDSDLDLDMLDKKDLSNIKFQRINEKTGKEVSWQNIVKGYLLNDKYVVLDDKDFEMASPEKTKTIEIAEFIDEKEVSSIYYEMPYYLKPDKSGVRPYALLHEALLKTGKAGLGSFVMRSKESLCLVKPYEGMLILNRIRFKEEIRPVSELNIPSSKPKPAELKMAVELIKQLSTEFEIGKYKDTYSEKLLKLIKAKAKGRKTTTPVMRVVHSDKTDLMAQLKASLSTSKKKAS